MAKNKSNANASTSGNQSTSIQGGKKRAQTTAAFEIDDIFAAATKPKPVPVVARAEMGSIKALMHKANEKDKKGKGKGKVLEQVPGKQVDENSDEDDSEDEDEDSDDSSAEFDPEQEDEPEIEDDDEGGEEGKHTSNKTKPQTLDSISAAILANKTKPVVVTRIVETVVDGSGAIERYRPPPMGRTGTKLDEDDLTFRDSRGDTRKRTEEGYPIYDTKELKIGLGGGTPDCPFDCQCCF
ncbi:BQ2448_1865 [Microbotryum intermedium]|uniref:BQ2448_1865 protein n=1 Tax=Microbotryum intermedium TaxID=269621 RepID=A0A238FED9_9BASI|nr:BQ2448_1865 [Microbotryum intermedium]